ncbi:MAG: sigma-54 interaction domain-containing protein [Thermoanaerobaculia bacterium]
MNLRQQPGRIVGESLALRRCLERLERLAPSDLPVLIQGETGTGKELAARRLHLKSPRRRRPLAPINCAALAPGLLVSELFGHVRGAFTGADRDRPGIFEAAEGGTVLLDEIGDLPLDAQGKLLRLLQEGEVRRLGESLPRRIDVRVVAATHRNLERMTDRGEFRRDLYYRLRVGRVELPPLRERGGDILLLAKTFLGALGQPPPRLSSAARRRLLDYTWPGNVRELKNVLEVAAALCDNGRIDANLLDLPEADQPARHGYHERLRRLRHSMVAEALDASGGNQAAAARRLGLSRQALSYLVRRLEIG